MGDLVPVKVTDKVGTIEDNLDLVELSIREKVQEYSAVIVTEDSVKDGKKFLADIRKEQKALDNERKEIKRRWMAPYDEFDKRAKQIIALYDEPVKVINGQLAEFEEQRKNLKRQEIKAAYDFVKGDLEEWLPLERIYDIKWENATYSGKKVREDMELLFNQMKLSISTVKSMNSEFEEDGLRVLKETGRLLDAIEEINDLQRQKARFAEQARIEAQRELQEQKSSQPYQEEAEAQEETAQTETLLEKTADQEIAETDMAPDTDDAPFAPERTLTVMVKVGENSLDMLTDYLDAAGLNYEVI